MKCKDFRTVTKHGRSLPPSAATEVTGHIETCAACRNLLLLDRLAPAIIRAAGGETTYDYSPARLINKIRGRIREMGEQRAGSWELAVEAMRGWLAAFALAAIILIAASLQWKASVVTSDFDHESDELITQNPAEY